MTDSNPSGEKLLFEISTPGARAVDLPASDVPHVELQPEWASFTETGLPEIGQLDLVRHYTHLSHRNFSVDDNFYPLGSCTMKYNPKVNEWAAALGGFANLHPMQPEGDCQGALALLYDLRVLLQEIAGLDEVSLQPCAGAHGEWTALKVITAWFKDHGQPQRRIVLAPDTAHGTNPASCAMCGAGVVTIKSRPDGLTDLNDLKKHLTGEVAAVMVTNPNTVGKFDAHIGEMADLVHKAGAFLYLDGANMNAILGIARPGDFGVDVMHYNTHKTFSTPHGCGGPGAGPIAVRKQFAPYLPVPQVVKHGDRYAWDLNRPKSIGKVRSFWGQFNVLVRAYTYIRACGPQGLRNVSESAILAANYVAQRIKDAYPLPYGPQNGEPMASNPCAHEFISVPRQLIDRGVTIMDIAKNLIDRGFHPPTVHWPVHDCLMIEPTETESKASLDAFADALLDIARESETNVEGLKQAPKNAPVRRLDEVAAARKPVLTWSAGSV
ncbi:MAG TPA: aminomethyl-transferring glycine dehydrogenase subunit GcvPB [Tepidisphaeraceae bacterium]|nr:aminomethyl-transferring glycine dehydrogenase subunit GcvPB [Tepidisphaeraceae bacterium]